VLHFCDTLNGESLQKLLAFETALIWEAVLDRRLFLIDSYGFIFRAYHARARMSVPAMRTTTGLSTEAVYIFNNMVRKLIKSFEPQHMAAVFESIGPTLREQEFTDYKANRTAMPPDLADQIPYVRRLLEAMRVPILEYAGYEADDVIGTLSCRAVEQGYEVVIVSSDKDMLQLVNSHVSMLNPAKDDAWYDPAKVKEFMGVEPRQVADLLALKGDAIDNIPGAPGVGDKGAIDLITQFGSVEVALERAGEVQRKMYRESLQNNRERILMSKRLATIETNIPLTTDLASLEVCEADNALLKHIYRELEFHSLLRELGPGEDTRTINSSPVTEFPDEPTAVVVGEMLSLCWEPGQVRTTSAADAKAWLEDETKPKIGIDVKSTLLGLSRAGVNARGFRDDVALYEFLLTSEPGACTLEQLAQRRLDLQAGAEVAPLVLELNALLSPMVDARGLRKIYEEIDLPIASVLARMEETGIRVDDEELKRLSGLMETEIARLTSEIHVMAGREFNISSPQQLGKILFEDLGLPAPFKYGKGKTVSTAADVLEGLAATHEIARKVLEYRQLTKLKGTYVDALPALMDPATRRIHTSFNQSGAATGRLSSSNPNLQNIPIKTAVGREIRAAFVPREGWKLIVADYSQIELRLMAHLSGDPVLLEAFRNNEDIHTRTAAEVMGVPPMLVTREARNNAKAVNFGIVYGISPFGLSAQLGIPRKEAETYISNYFVRYAGVKAFIDNTIAEVRRTGVTKTLLGRERPIPDMNSKNPNARGFAERTAVNSPLQGTAADLIKVAMIRIDRKLAGTQSKLLLQVHDELVLESPPEEAEEVAAMVKQEMENVYPLDVPLLVETGIGVNWRDSK
jgi:DNA polymerase I